jgi:hypothetical protein
VVTVTYGEGCAAVHRQCQEIEPKEGGRRFNPPCSTKRMAEGHSKLEAIRCLKRYIAREVFAIISPRRRDNNSIQVAA